MEFYITRDIFLCGLLDSSPHIVVMAWFIFENSSLYNNRGET